MVEHRIPHFSHRIAAHFSATQQIVSILYSAICSLIFFFFVSFIYDLISLYYLEPFEIVWTEIEMGSMTFLKSYGFVSTACLFVFEVR